MATSAENIATSITNIAAEIAAITANPKPFYIFTDGNGRNHEVSAVIYRQHLTDQLNALLDLQVRLAEPWMVKARVRAR